MHGKTENKRKMKKKDRQNVRGNVKVIKRTKGREK